MKTINKLKQIFRRDKVLFADLDGTIIVTLSGNTFPNNAWDWKFKNGILDAMYAYKPTHLHIVSNQGGISKGFVKYSDWLGKMTMIINELREHLPETRITFDYCISNDPKDPHRKPNPGMIDAYCIDAINNTDCSKRNCMMIGDASGKPGQFSDSDKKCAENAHVKYMDVDDFINEYNPNNI